MLAKCVACGRVVAFICIHVLYTSKCLPNRCRFGKFCRRITPLPFIPNRKYTLSHWQCMRRRGKKWFVDFVNNVRMGKLFFLPHRTDWSTDDTITTFARQHVCSHFANVSQFKHTHTKKDSLMQLSIYTLAIVVMGPCSATDFFGMFSNDERGITLIFALSEWKVQDMYMLL